MKPKWEFGFLLPLCPYSSAHPTHNFPVEVPGSGLLKTNLAHYVTVLRCPSSIKFSFFLFSIVHCLQIPQASRLLQWPSPLNKFKKFTPSEVIYNLPIPFFNRRSWCAPSPPPLPSRLEDPRPTHYNGYLALGAPTNWATLPSHAIFLPWTHSILSTLLPVGLICFNLLSVMHQGVGGMA